MKKKLLIMLLCMLSLVLLWYVCTGFMPREDVYIGEFALSEDGTQLHFEAGVGSSMGYIRGFKDNGGGVKPHYLKFYSAWGGFNSALGAECAFILELSPQDSEIYLYRGDGGYELVLEKDPATGEWERVK